MISLISQMDGGKFRLYLILKILGEMPDSAYRLMSECGFIKVSLSIILDDIETAKLVWKIILTLVLLNRGELLVINENSDGFSVVFQTLSVHGPSSVELAFAYLGIINEVYLCGQLNIIPFVELGW